MQIPSSSASVRYSSFNTGGRGFDRQMPSLSDQGHYHPHVASPYGLRHYTQPTQQTGAPSVHAHHQVQSYMPEQQVQQLHQGLVQQHYSQPIQQLRSDYQPSSAPTVLFEPMHWRGDGSSPRRPVVSSPPRPPPGWTTTTHEAPPQHVSYLSQKDYLIGEEETSAYDAEMVDREHSASTAQLAGLQPFDQHHRGLPAFAEGWAAPASYPSGGPPASNTSGHAPAEPTFLFYRPQR